MKKTYMLPCITKEDFEIEVLMDVDKSLPINNDNSSANEDVDQFEDLLIKQRKDYSSEESGNSLW